MKVWSFILFSPKVQCMSIEMVANEPDIDLAVDKAKKQLKSSVNIKEFRDSSFKQIFVSEQDAETFHVYMASSIEVPIFSFSVAEETVEDMVQKEKESNVQKFVNNLELVKDMFAKGDKEKLVIDGIKRRILKSVDKSEVLVSN